MAIRSLPNASCSLNLGLIYRLSMSFQPGDGVRITAYFVNESGNYVAPILNGRQEASIRFGALAFAVLPVSYSLGLAYGRRIMQVTFIDGTRVLDEYLITLPGRGCGQNVIVLGRPMNPSLLTPRNDNERIQNFTQFQDYEYSFSDFITEINKVISVTAPADVDNTITKPFTGTLREVLNAWCSFFGLAWYVENSKIRVINPSTFAFTFPTPLPPADAIDFETFESIEDCYDTTAALYFNQQGGVRNVNQAASEGNLKIDGDLTVLTATLYPVGHEFNLSQVMPDLNQVAAAMYGKSTWFLYNLYNNIANISTECGWTPIQNAGGVSATSISSVGGQIAVIDENLFEQKFQAYAEYGESIAGRYYLSAPRSDIDLLPLFSWFNETEGQIFDYTTEDANALKIDFRILSQGDNPDVIGGAPPDFPDTFFPPNVGVPDGYQNVVEGTTINQYYPGINYTDNRLLWFDKAFPAIATEFALNTTTSSSLDNLFNAYFNGAEGSQSFSFSTLQPASGRKLVAYFVPNITGVEWQNVRDVLASIPAKAEKLKPRFTAVNASGIRTGDLASLSSSKTAQANGEELTIITSNPNDTSPVFSNTSYIKAIVQGEYSLYFTKFSKCVSASSTPSALVRPIKRKFQMKDVSTDIEVPVTLQKTSGNAYKLDRNLTNVNKVVNESLAKKFAIGNTIPRRRTTFKTNYLVDGITSNFFQQGLVAFDLEINDNGIDATYTFGNDLVSVPDTPAAIEKLEREIKNSWIRTFNPPQTFPSA